MTAPAGCDDSTPYRMGKPLTSSWKDNYSARRSEWRITYRIDDHRFT